MDATATDDESTDDAAAPAERDSDADGGAPSDDSTTGDDAPADTDDVEPAQATYAWAPDGASCDRCAATVTARWRDGDDLVCADCKDW